MEYRKDIQTDVFRWIGNHSNHKIQAMLIAQFHDFSKFFCASHVHGFQTTQIREQMKTSGQIRQQRNHILAATLDLFHSHMLNETQMQ